MVANTVEKKKKRRRAEGEPSNGTHEGNGNGGETESSEKSAKAGKAGKKSDAEKPAADEKPANEAGAQPAGDGKPTPRKRKSSFEIQIVRKVKLKHQGPEKNKTRTKIFLETVDGTPPFKNTTEATRWVKDNGIQFQGQNFRIIQVREVGYVEAITRVRVRTGASSGGGPTEEASS